MDPRHRRCSSNHPSEALRRNIALQSGRQKKQEQDRGSGHRRMPKVRGVQDDPGRRQGRHNEGPVRPLALLESATRHDLRGTEVVVAAERVGLLEAARMSPSTVVAVAFLLAFHYRLLPRPEVRVLRECRRRCFREQVQF